MLGQPSPTPPTVDWCWAQHLPLHLDRPTKGFGVHHPIQSEPSVDRKASQISSCTTHTIRMQRCWGPLGFSITARIRMVDNTWDAQQQPRSSTDSKAVELAIKSEEKGRSPSLFCRTEEDGSSQILLRSYTFTGNINFLCMWVREREREKIDVELGEVKEKKVLESD